MTLIKENLKTKGQAYYPAKTVAANAMRVQCDFTQNPDGICRNYKESKNFWKKNLLFYFCEKYKDYGKGIIQMVS